MLLDNGLANSDKKQVVNVDETIWRPGCNGRALENAIKYCLCGDVPRQISVRKFK